MAHPKVRCGSFSALAEEGLYRHLADDGLDEIRPVEAVEAVCAEDAFLLQHYD